MKIYWNLKALFSVTALVVSLLAAVTVIASLSIRALATAELPRVMQDPLVHPTYTLKISTLDPSPPSETVKLVFIHHSIGDSWLDDGYGDLGAALGANNYHVSEAYYEWGPVCPDCNGCNSPEIGSCTDIGHWWEWFRGANSSLYLSELYSTTYQHADYVRPMADPGGENEIIMFKSCFPNSRLQGSPDDPPTVGANPLRGQPFSSPFHTVGNAKGIYNDLLVYLETRQDKLFVIITAPPDLGDAYADNARAFNNWLVYDWLDDYPYRNVVVFDYYNVLTTNGGDPDTNDLSLETGNHHRLVTSTTPITIEHITDGDDDDSPNTLEYPTDGGTNKHPTPAGDQKATGEFIPLLNVYYNCWKHGACGTAAVQWISVGAVNDTASVYPGARATWTLAVTASVDFTMPVTLTLHDAPPDAVTSFDPGSVIPPGSSQLYITTTLSTAPETYLMTVAGTSGPLTDTAFLTLTVRPALFPSPTLFLTVQPVVRAISTGETAVYTLSVGASEGFSAPVTLTLQGAPPGVAPLFAPNPVIPPGSSQLSVSTVASTTVGIYTMTVSAASGTLTDSAGLILILTSATPSFTLSVSPTVRVATPAQVVSFTVGVTGANGFSRPVALAVVGLPAGVGAAWSVNPITPDAFSKLTLVVPGQSSSGEHALQVVGTAGTQNVSRGIRLIIAYVFKYYLPMILKQL